MDGKRYDLLFLAWQLAKRLFTLYVTYLQRFICSKVSDQGKAQKINREQKIISVSQFKNDLKTRIRADLTRIDQFRILSCRWLQWQRTQFVQF